MLSMSRNVCLSVYFFVRLSVCSLLRYRLTADNDSLTQQDREDLHEVVFRKIIKPSHEDYVKTLLATANQANIKIIYTGFQSPPKPDQETGFVVRMWNNSGTHRTPWFREKYREDYHKEDKYHRVLLEYPNDIDKQAGSGSLEIQLEVDTREEEDWQEVVRVKTRQEKHKFFTEKKSWPDAEAHCQGDGGHLASVHSEEEMQEVETLNRLGYVWLGGNDQQEEGNWKWSDWSPWGYTPKWQSGYGSKGKSYNCIGATGEEMWDWTCTVTYSFICRYDPHFLRGNVNLTLT